MFRFDLGHWGGGVVHSLTSTYRPANEDHLLRANSSLDMETTVGLACRRYAVRLPLEDSADMLDS
jgi:hypothetical protein